MDPTATSSSPRDRSPIVVQLDNLIRRQLRISDPANPTEVATGLRRLYREDAVALEQEERGFAIAPVTPAFRPIPTASPSSSELEQAQRDVERDLSYLTTSSQLKDIEAELMGWGQAIRNHIAEGLAHARNALDPRARDRAFAARRALGDYARMARLVGAMTPGFSIPYRRLAQSLDQVASLILVLMGESLAQLGAGGGQFLLAAPASELISRRDAALNSLRTMIGSTEASLDQGTWPWGLRGYREVMGRLGAAAQADVRALFEENALAQMMDELIDRASSTAAPGLRALAATGQLAVQRLERVVQVAAAINTNPASPPVAAFLEALQLFIDGFRGGGGGSRLISIARPPIVAYGLYGFGGPDIPTQRLQMLTTQRGVLAQMLDCWLGCDCCGDEVICQALLDKLLFDLDRAIDLYALGFSADGAGEPEVRAVAYGLLMETYRTGTLVINDREIDCRSCLVPSGSLDGVLAVVAGVLLAGLTPGAVSVAVSPLPIPGPLQQPIMRQELCLQRFADQRWGELLATLTPGCTESGRVLQALAWLVDSTLETVDGRFNDCVEARVRVPPTLEDTFDPNP
jgi:hypothetical protein